MKDFLNSKGIYIDIEIYSSTGNKYRLSELLTEYNQALQLRENAVSSSYDWLNNQNYAYIQGSVMFPVKVEIVSLDFENELAEIKTDYQSGKVEFSRLYKSEMSCPCR